MANVCLVYFDIHTGHYPGFHHGLAYLIGALRQDGHEVSLRHVIDQRDFDATRTFLLEQKPAVIGLSFTTNQRQYARRFLDAFTPQPNGALVIAGGVHATLVGDRFFEEFPEIKAICIGEGEAPLAELCRRLDRSEDLQSTPSFFFNVKDSVIKNDISPLQDIDQLAMPDYSLFDYRKIIAENGDNYPVMISRGCPYSCHYCCNHVLRESYPNKEKYVRFASPLHAVQIIRNNLKLYPAASRIQFDDDTIALNKAWLREFFQLYKKDIQLPFVCNTRVETIDDNTVDILKTAGCSSVNFGVESGNKWIREHVLNRKYSNAQIKTAFDRLREAGIKAFSFNMIGLPFETSRMAEDTLNLNQELRPYFGACFYFCPYPKTKLYELCVAYDLLDKDADTVSGYWEAPSIKGVFMSKRRMVGHFRKLRAFFYGRLLFARFRFPFWIERFLLKLIILMRAPLLGVLEPNSKSRIISVFRKGLRAYAMRNVR